MITKLYWAARLLGYFACLGGVFFHLSRLQRPAAAASWIGLALIGAGVRFFFLSYGLRAWLRFGGRRKSEEPPAL